MAFPSTFDELVAKSYPVRVVNDVIDRLNIQNLPNPYQPKTTLGYQNA
ncbi:hypothetical protein [Pedobacter jeongneungensis]|nr:hypothetical protein [Pedobacter jeongneungensis]